MNRRALPRLGALLAAALACGPSGRAAAAAAIPLDTVVTTLAWDDNLANADAASDRAGDTLVGARFSLDRTKPVSGRDRVTFHLHIDLQEAWHHPKAAESRLGGGPGWERKFGLGPFAPVLGAGVVLDAVASRDNRRLGFVGEVILRGRFRLAEPTILDVSQSFSDRGARHDLFEARTRESTLTLRHDLGADWQLTAEARWREGEVVSFATPPRPDLAALAAVLVPLDPTFGSARTAYAVDARSLAGSLTLSRRLSQDYALAVGHQHRTTRRGALDYSARRWQISLRRDL
jgi:hypothetical protein